MSKTEGSQTKYFCDECSASFLTQKGLETHFQRQHGNTVMRVLLIWLLKKLKISLGIMNTRSTCIAFLFPLNI